ncbi:glutathione S-transferase D7 [Parasteatoda tepidariorum]|uniref:glutathione S-transferase D7 n=1 Tax=Parasteatoda tepidariorum TaxID=114398 RepID=UPI001C7289E2|nr:glutathione S-transferase D7 [Parasteatoda tepidariorum]
MAITLYEMAVSPPCRAVLMVIRHLGIEVNRKHLNLLTGDHLKPEFVKLNPLHQVPVLDDNGFVLSESRAILTYLCNKYAPDSSLYPKDPKVRAIVDRMLYFDSGTLHMTQKAVTRPIMLTGKSAGEEQHEAYRNALRFFEEFLSRTSYAAGNHITLADYSIFATLTMAEAFKIKFDDYPKVSAWMEKLKSEVPSHKELNEEPLQQLKEYMKSKNYI